MGKRVVAWCTYGIVFALIPLIASILIHFFAGQLSFKVLSHSPELLFFSLMVCATVLGDLNDIVAADVVDLTVPILRSALSVGVILSAILYGAFISAEVAGKVDDVFATRVFWFSLILAVLSAAVATFGEIFLAKIGT